MDYVLLPRRSVVVQAVQAAKRMADRRWGERLGNDFEGNKKMFWKEVQGVSKGEQAREEMVKDVLLPRPSRAGWISGGMFKERWCGSVGMAR